VLLEEHPRQRRREVISQTEGDNQPTANPSSENVIGISVTSRKPGGSTPDPAQTCPKSFTCPANNGCLYAAGSRTLALSCGTDSYGGDIENYRAASLEECTKSCGANSKCVAASFVDATSQCYLKGTKKDPNFDDYVNGALDLPNFEVCRDCVVLTPNSGSSRHHFPMQHRQPGYQPGCES